jgi:imidazolonepropionase-like amidohydrolase
MLRRAAFVVLLAIVLASWPGCARPSARGFSFTHVTIVDLTGGQTQTDMTVTVSGDRIVAVAPSSPEVPGGVVVDAGGAFLIPGLWDMHAHWADEEYLAAFTVNGVTGVRLMNGFPGHLDWRRRIDSGSEVGPRLRIAGPFVDGAKPTYPEVSIAVASPPDARAAVQTTKSTGYDYVKTYSGLDRDSFFALADECKRQNIPFVGHVPDGVGADEYAQQGGLSMEHLRRVDFACADLVEDPSNPPDLSVVAEAYDPVKAAGVFALFRQTGTWQCPTLVVSYKQLAGNPGLLDDPRLAFLPPSIQAYYGTLTLTPRRPPDQAQAILDNERTMVAGMQQAGVGLLAGTDAPTYGVLPGFGLHEELALLVDAGLSPLEALQAATLNPARFLGLEADLGAVEAGKLADLVLLDANPLDDIHNTTTIRAVVQNGKLLARQDLDRMLADLQAKAASGQDSHPWPMN